MSNKSRRNGPGRSGSSPRASSRPAPTSGRAPQQPVARQDSARRSLERFSAPILVTLHGMPRWIVPVVMAALLFLGLILTGPYAWIGTVLLVVVGIFVLWLSALSWPILTGSARLMRVLVVGAVFGVAVLKALGRF